MPVQCLAHVNYFMLLSINNSNNIKVREEKYHIHEWWAMKLILVTPLWP